MSFDLEFKQKTQINISVYGATHSLHKPTVSEIEDFGLKALKNKKDEESMELMKGFVSSLGLPREVIDGMEFEHFKQLCDFLTGSKKN
jgi:hypothetical protein